jgi:hypothetical protein
MHRITFIWALMLAFSSLSAQIPEGFARSIFLSYQEKPERIYENQVFTVTLKAMVGRDDYENIETYFFPSSLVEILNPDAKWDLDSDTTFYATYHVKSSGPNVTLPRVRVSLVQSGITVESEFLDETPIEVVALNHDSKSSNLMAQSLHVKRFKTSRFDNTRLIMVLEMEGVGANFQDFKLNGFHKQGLDSLDGEYPNQNAFYFIVFDDHLAKIQFRYFNLQNNHFETIQLPVVLEEDDLSTQIGLNPKESPFEFYKNIAIGLLILLLIIVSALRKKIFYLILALILGSYYLYTKSPFSMITVAKDTRLRIVPAEKSTIFYTTDKVLQVERLGSRDNYIKILLPTGEIGWIKDENVLSN